MEHKHEPLIGLDGIIKCRTCGQILSSIVETIGRVSSGKRAKRILEEIAVTGKYRATNFKNNFVVYTRSKDGLTEEITAEKLGERDFIVIKKTISESSE